MLWISWMYVVWQLKPAFSNYRTFFNFIFIMMAFSTRREFGGMASIIRTLRFKPIHYQTFCDHFRSNAINLQQLTKLWCQIVLKIFGPYLLKFNGRILLIIDGIKAPKEGKRMAGVKKHYQTSSCNSKPDYIWGHSCQGISLIVSNTAYTMAIPLIMRIHEGIGHASKTILDKALDLISSTSIKDKFYLVGDAYYFSGDFGNKLTERSIHLITRVRRNAVAYNQPKNSLKKKRGRPQKYGEKIYLRNLFTSRNYVKKNMNIYGKSEEVMLMSKILISRSHKSPLKYVFIKRQNGSEIFVSTDLKLKDEEIIFIYNKRFKIEVTFKEFVNNLGGFTYRFWSKAISRERKKETVKKSLTKEMSYHLHLQYVTIVQGLLKYLSLSKTMEVWKKFDSWLRTIRQDVFPSEQIVMTALSNEVFDFLKGFNVDKKLKKLYEHRSGLENKVYWESTG